MARVHHYDDAPRKPDNQRHAEQVARTADEGVNKALFAQTPTAMPMPANRNSPLIRRWEPG